MNQQTRPIAMSFVLSVLLPSGTLAHASDWVAKEYPIQSVDSVYATGPGRVTIVQGDHEALRVEASADDMSRVYVDQTGHRLSLKFKDSKKGWFDWFNHNYNNEDIRYTLTVKKLDELELSGALEGQVSALNTQALRVKLSGASNCHFDSVRASSISLDFSGAANGYFKDVAANSMDAGLSGAANLDIKSQSSLSTIKVDASGASNFRGKSITVKQALVIASGASNITVNASETLDASASGASNIYYVGSPKVKLDTSGASNIKQIN